MDCKLESCRLRRKRNAQGSGGNKQTNKTRKFPLSLGEPGQMSHLPCSSCAWQDVIPSPFGFMRSAEETGVTACPKVMHLSSPFTCTVQWLHCRVLRCAFAFIHAVWGLRISWTVRLMCLITYGLVPAVIS